MGTRRYVVKFAFDGHRFLGYARQPGGGTVEDELIGALVGAKLIDGPKEASFASAGRVDRGVSALGAAAAFDTDAGPGRVLRSVNARTGSLVVHSIAEVDRGFDPRRRAESRWYRYHFPRPPAGTALDLEAMGETAGAFLGEHDFTAFARLEGRDPRRRVLEVGVDETEGTFLLDVVGESFLWNQVRRMASAVLMAGRGELTRRDLESSLATGVGGPYPPLPAHGLVLMDVAYEGLEFRRAERLPRGTVERWSEARDMAASRHRLHRYVDERIMDGQGIGPGPGRD